VFLYAVEINKLQIRLQALLNS